MGMNFGKILSVFRYKPTITVEEPAKGKPIAQSMGFIKPGTVAPPLGECEMAIYSEREPSQGQINADAISIGASTYTCK